MKPSGRRLPADVTADIAGSDPMLPSKNSIRGPWVSPLLDDQRLESVKEQPGVLAVIAFYEGFAVKSAGSGDFDQVAAVAEDFLRSGKKIVSDMKMGKLSQITLEAGDKNCIVVPCGDLFLCLVTRADVNLGLIRLMIRHLQGTNGTGAYAKQ
jgi:predicted regulator of Ras-like GTPase activity (Roadblock/LC7/MglB family)